MLALGVTLLLIMKTLITEIRIAVVSTIVLALICCGAYPFLVYGIGNLLFAREANGSLIQSEGKVSGSELLGQPFANERYFHSRPSAAGTGYDASNSGGTNLGPTSQKLVDSVKAAVEQYRKENDLAPGTLVPGDAVTSSASGLDPHISLKNARLQAPRVAKARGMALADVQAEMDRATDKAFLGIIGDSGVNVLKLNLALDARSK